MRVAPWLGDDSWLTERVCERLGEQVSVGLSDEVRLSDGVEVVLRVPVSLVDAEGLGVGVGEGVDEQLCEVVEDWDEVCVAVTLPVVVELGVSVSEAVPEKEGDGETERLSMALGEAVEERVPDNDGLWLAEPLLVDEAVPEGVGAADGVIVGVALGTKSRRHVGGESDATTEHTADVKFAEMVTNPEPAVVYTAGQLASNATNIPKLSSDAKYGVRGAETVPPRHETAIGGCPKTAPG